MTTTENSSGEQTIVQEAWEAPEAGNNPACVWPADATAAPGMGTAVVELWHRGHLVAFSSSDLRRACATPPDPEGEQSRLAVKPPYRRTCVINS